MQKNKVKCANISELLLLLIASFAVSKSIKNKITSLLHLSTANKTAGEHKKRTNKNNFFLAINTTLQKKELTNYDLKLSILNNTKFFFIKSNFL